MGFATLEGVIKGKGRELGRGRGQGCRPELGLALKQCLAVYCRLGRKTTGRAMDWIGNLLKMMHNKRLINKRKIGK
jgi:hypothetical protein